MGEAVDPLDARGLAGLSRRLDPALLRLRRRRRHLAAELCQAIIRSADFDSGPGHGTGFHAVLRSLWEDGKRTEFADIVNQTVYRISAASFLASAWMMTASLPLIDLVFPARALHLPRLPGNGYLLFLVRALPGFVVGAGPICAGVLRLG